MAGHAVNTSYDWNLTYVPSRGVNNRAFLNPQGKGVGGGSLLNRMVFDRGSAADYDRWESLGNSGWGWDGLLPFFKKVLSDGSFFPFFLEYNRIDSMACTERDLHPPG
jgi:choline dehydrogenase-like flavoprotein